MYIRDKIAPPSNRMQNAADYLDGQNMENSLLRHVAPFQDTRLLVAEGGERCRELSDIHMYVSVYNIDMPRDKAFEADSNRVRGLRTLGRRASWRVEEPDREVGV